MGNLAFWPVYFIINNFNYKTKRQYRKPNKLLPSLILIHKENNVDV